MNFSKENETSMVAALRTKAINAMAVALAAALLMIVLGACSKSAKSNEDGTLSGTVSTNGSTSMERVVGGLAEAFDRLVALPPERVVQMLKNARATVESYAWPNVIARLMDIYDEVRVGRC